jgi:hypothetical protein
VGLKYVHVYLNKLYRIFMKSIIYLNDKKFEDQKLYISKHILGIVYKNIVISQIEGKGRGLLIQSEF